MSSSEDLPQNRPVELSSDEAALNSPRLNGGDGVTAARAASPGREGFVEDFQRFFVRGLAALLPTLITLWLLVWVWDFLWMNVGRHIVLGIRWVWMTLSYQSVIPFKPAGYIWRMLDDNLYRTRVLGVVLAVLAIYIVGVFVGNLLGRTMWRLAEHGVMKVPLLRGIYPAVKQITDFVLSEKTDQFQASKVVAVEPHAKGIWSIGLVTGSGLRRLSDATGQEMVTVFVPSSPTAFSGYVLVVPKSSVIELPLKVEEAMRLLVSGGVIAPGIGPAQNSAAMGPGEMRAAGRASTGGAEELLSLRSDGRAMAASARIPPLAPLSPLPPLGRETRQQQSA